MEKNPIEVSTEGNTVNTEIGEDGEKDVKKQLVAIYPILYLSHQYKVGDMLPANNADMVAAWLEAGTAIWVDDETENAGVKARPYTAEPGQSGSAAVSETGTAENLVGKVPKTDKRSKK